MSSSVSFQGDLTVCADAACDISTSGVDFLLEESLLLRTPLPPFAFFKGFLILLVPICAAHGAIIIALRGYARRRIAWGFGCSHPASPF